MKLYVGCCGFPISMKKYFSLFEVVEVQKTFYQIPENNTLEKWRKNAPKSFIFNLKCFQGVTHDVSSPTWRRYKQELRGRKENYGFLKPTKEVLKSWNETLKAAKILKSKIIVVQLSAKFKPSKENWHNAKKFFQKIKKNGISIAIELRKWDDKNREKFCKRFYLIDVVDPFKNKPKHFSKKKIAYFRLHGSPPGKKTYAYKYTKKDLLYLKNFVERLKVKKCFIMFNNMYMLEDAKRLIKIMSL